VCWRAWLLARLQNLLNSEAALGLFYKFCVWCWLFTHNVYYYLFCWVGVLRTSDSAKNNNATLCYLASDRFFWRMFLFAVDSFCNLALERVPFADYSKHFRHGDVETNCKCCCMMVKTMTKKTGCNTTFLVSVVSCVVTKMSRACAWVRGRDGICLHLLLNRPCCSLGMLLYCLRICVLRNTALF
jgi:hypothetical protein